MFAGLTDKIDPQLIRQAALNIATRVSIGLRVPYMDRVLQQFFHLTWIEVHGENRMAEAGSIAQRLSDIPAAFDPGLHTVDCPRTWAIELRHHGLGPSRPSHDCDWLPAPQIRARAARQ